MKFAHILSLLATLSIAIATPAIAESSKGHATTAKQGYVQLAQNGAVSRSALMRWCATVPDRFRTAVFERRCAALRQASRSRLGEWCNRMPLHWQSRRMQQRCAFIVGRPDRRDDGFYGGDGRNFGGRCNVRRLVLTVRSRGCSGQSRRVDFRRPFLRPGESAIRSVTSGVIGKGHPPHGVCNFQTRLRYRCIRGRVRITGVFECRQGRSGQTGANCSLSYAR